MEYMSVNFPLVLFSLLDFSTLEDGIDRLSWNDSKNYHSTLCSIPEEHMPHVIWRCRPWFGSAWSGLEWCGLVRSGSVLHTWI